LIRRHGIDNPIGADLGRVVVQDRHARVDAGFHGQRGQLEVAQRHRLHRAGERRDDRSQYDAVDCRFVDAAACEQPFDEQTHFVGSPLTDGGEPPAANEPRRIEHAKHDIRIADVDC
jgi:hypothetical protein